MRIELEDLTIQSLQEAVVFSKGKNAKAVVHVFSPVDVKESTPKIGASQNEFTSAFGISAKRITPVGTR